MGVSRKIAKNLQRAPKIDLSLTLSIRSLKSKTLISNPSKSDIQCEKVLLANFGLLIKSKYRDVNPKYLGDIFLKIPRKGVKNSRGNTKNLTDFKIQKVLNIWIDMGLIEQFKGYSWWGRVSPNCYKLTLKGFNYITSINSPIRLGNLVFKKIEGQKIPVRSSTKAQENTLLKNYNELLNRSNIKEPGDALPRYFHYKRIFSYTTQLGGRVHDSVQRMPKSKRKTLTIGGKKTFEADFNACHIQLTYILEDRMAPNPLFRDTNKYSQEELKKAALVMLNTSSKSSAAFGIVEVLKRDLFKKIKNHFSLDSINHDKFMALRAKAIKGDLDKKGKDILLNEGNLLKIAYEMINVVLRQHPLLKNHFFNDSALTLQKMESDLCMEVIRRCTERSIPVITIHDSFIGPRDDLNEILEIIRESSLKTLGSALKISVE